MAIIFVSCIFSELHAAQSVMAEIRRGKKKKKKDRQKKPQGKNIMSVSATIGCFVCGHNNVRKCSK